MATIVTENKTVMGQPMYRFEISSSEGTEFFDQGWKAAVKAHQLHKNGIEIFYCREWDKGTREWVDATEETINEGYGRYERLRARSGKDPEPKEVVPTLSEDARGKIIGASNTLKMVAIAGKTQLPSDDDKRQVGMELMEVLSALGYDIKEIKSLVTQYGHSVNAQPLSPELVK